MVHLMSQGDKGRVRGELRLKGGVAHLSISANGASAVAEQLRHVVVAGELPQTCFQVEVSVEPQRAGSPEGRTELVRCGLTNHFRVFGGVGEEAVASLHLCVVQQVGTAMVSHAGTIGAESEFKVGQGSSGHHRQHT